MRDAAAGRAAEALHAAGDPAGRGERDRSGLAADEGQPPLHPGLQRAGGRQRAADRARRGDHHRRRRLLAPATDDRRPRSASSSRPGETEQADGRGRRRAVLERAAHGRRHRRARDPGADPAGLRQTQRRATRLDRRAVLIHAARARDRARRGAVPKTTTDRSSRSSVTPNTTASSTASTERGRPPCAPSGD